MGGEKEGGEDTVMALENNSTHIQEVTSKPGSKWSPFRSWFLQRKSPNRYAATEQEKEGVQAFTKVGLMY